MHKGHDVDYGLSMPTFKRTRWIIMVALSDDDFMPSWYGIFPRVSNALHLARIEHGILYD